MFDLWKNELTEQETDDLVQKAAHEIKKRKLELPATLFFEMHKPLSFVGSQAAIVFAPFLVPFVGFEGINSYTQLFSDRQNVDKLLDAIQDPAEGQLRS